MAKSDPAIEVAVPGLCCASVAETPLTHPDAITLAHVLAALADPVRLQLFSIVAAQGEVCSCDLEEPVKRSQPTISHHTKWLKPGSSSGRSAVDGCGGESNRTAWPMFARRLEAKARDCSPIQSPALAAKPTGVPAIASERSAMKQDMG